MMSAKERLIYKRKLEAVREADREHEQMIVRAAERAGMDTSKVPDLSPSQRRDLLIFHGDHTCRTMKSIMKKPESQ